MPKQSGFTFLELVVVVGLVGIVAAFSVSSSNAPVSAEKMLGEARTNASQISSLVLYARSSQTSIKLTCTSKSLTASYYRGQKSNKISGSLGLDVVTATAGAVTKGPVNLISYPATSSMTLTCPIASAYITSDGSLLTVTGVPYDLVFSSSKKTVSSDSGITSKLSISNVGYPRIYLMDTSLSASWNEVVL